MSGVLTVYGVELRKLRAQWTVRFVLPVLAIAPWIFVLLIKHQDRLPLETLYGRFLKTTGFAAPMTTLAFSAAWILPLLAAIVRQGKAEGTFSPSSAEHTAGVFLSLVLSLNETATRLYVGASSVWRTTNSRAATVTWTAVKPPVGSRVRTS